MTRPPWPVSGRSVEDRLVVRDGRLWYLPLDFQDLVELAAHEAGGLAAGDARDVTRTLYEMAALVGHVLAVHQDRYAGEAFLGTAQAGRSLVKHGRRLGYEPDPGSTATGFLHVEAKAGVAGEVPAGLTVASAPHAGARAEEFQTVAARQVRSDWNRIEVAAPTQSVSVPAGVRSLVIAGTGHGLVAGEPAMLVGPAYWTAIDLIAIADDRDAGTTTVTLRDPLPVALGTLPAFDPQNPAAGYQILARPQLELRPFGWDADPTMFPGDQLEEREQLSGTGAVDPPQYGYRVEGTDSTRHDTTEIFLSRAIADRLEREWVMVVRRDDVAVYRVRGDERDQTDRSVAFVRAHRRTDITPPASGNGLPTATWVRDERQISGTVTRLHIANRFGSARTRAEITIRATILTRWKVRAPLLTAQPSSAAVETGAPLVLAGVHPLEPGMLVALSTRDRRRSQVVELIEVEPGATTTAIRYKAVTAPAPFTLGDVIVLGNVVRIAHGVLRDEVLGDSEGTSPFLRFELKKAPLGYLAGAAGVVPDLEVRVSGVLWDRVVDFHDSAPDSRHYKVEREADGTTHVVFGDGRRGAIPPAGRGHISARYRIGLGAAGNVDAGRVSRVVKAHPLVDRVVNPTATGGGTEPASPEGVRRQATRYIRTFDRAVSVTDHADLALLFPGVARAAAWFDGGVVLVAATDRGESLADAAPLFEFLEQRRDRATPMRLANPEPIAVRIRLFVEIDRAYLEREVEAAVRAALVGTDPTAPGLFTFAARDLGQAAHASEVYARVNAVAGVSYCQLLQFDLAPGTALRDVIRPQAWQWLRLDAGQLAFAPPEEADRD